MRIAAVALALSLTLVGCKKKEGEAKGGSAATGAGADVSKATGPCTGAKAHGPLTWFEDDYPAAIACAKATRRPLVIDMWAPWCHTCLSMQTTVFTDASLKPMVERYMS